MAWRMDSQHAAINQHVITRGKSAIIDVKMDANVKCDVNDDPGKVLARLPTNMQQELVLNCHGSSGHVEIGSGIGAANVNVFRKIRHRYKAIWLSACNAAMGQSGLDFCQRVADETLSYVVASPDVQFQSNSLPDGHIKAMRGKILIFSHKWKDPKEPPWNDFGKPEIPHI